MKKLLSILLLISVMSFAFNFIACGEPEEYRVKLQAEGASLSVDTFTVKIGDNYELPTPEKMGYKFVEWTLGTSSISSKGVWDIDMDTTLVAKFQPLTYNVILSDIYGAQIGTYTATYDQAYDLTPPSSINEVFDGWYYYEGDIPRALTGEVWNINQNDLVLFAKCKPTAITFNLDGGSADFELTKSVVFGEEFDLSGLIPTKASTPGGKVILFDGWYNGETKVEKGKWNINLLNVELKAKWVEKDYSDEY